MAQASKRWKAQAKKLLAAERTQPQQWFYMSFADEVFRGVVIMRGHGIGDCTVRCHQLGINPGGQVMCVPMPDEILAQIPEESRMRLLSKQDVQAIWPDAKTIREHEAEVGDGPSQE